VVWLLNWLWQGALLTAVVAAGLATTRRLNAATRERVLWLTLAAVLLIPCAALVREGRAPGLANEAIASPVTSALPLIELPEELPAWTAGFWLLWIAWSVVGLAGLLRAVLQLRRIRRRVSAFPAARERQLTRWMSLGGSDPSPPLVISSDVHHAAVLGGTNPVIAISPATAAALTDDELDQVVVHEHAHVRRRDYMAVVAQRIAWVLAGFHPAVWWIDRALKLEREVACDDWVLAHATAPQAYGACLVKLAEARGPAEWQPAPGAALSRSELSQRVVRVLDPRRNRTVGQSPAALSFAMMVICGTAIAGLRLPIAGQSRAATILDFIALPLVSRGESAAVIEAEGPVEDLPSDNIAVARMSARDETLASGGLSPDAFVLDRPDPPPAISLPSLPQGLTSLASLQTLPTVAAPQIDLAPIATERQAVDERSPWLGLADAGMTIGDGAREAGVRTGGFFARLGKSVGSAF